MMPATDIAESAWARGCKLEEEERYEEAAAAYRIAAELGHALAQSNLGNLLDDKLTPQQPDEAVVWYERAVTNGNEVGAWNLSMHYRNRGDEAAALHWMTVAANMGCDDAQTILSRMKSIV